MWSGTGGRSEEEVLENREMGLDDVESILNEVLKIFADFGVTVEFL